jgi:hypothetical protein
MLIPSLPHHPSLHNRGKADKAQGPKKALTKAVQKIQKTKATKAATKSNTTKAPEATRKYVSNNMSECHPIIHVNP